MNNIKKIAILGKANSGKNTTADLLSAALFPSTIVYNNSSRRTKMIAFANPIKKMVMTMFPWGDRDCLYGASWKRNQVIPNAFDRDHQPLTYRKALIDIGKQGRAYDPDHWIKVYDYAIKAIPSTEYNSWEQELPPIGLIVCPDVRFQNEVEYLEENQYHIIKIVRDNIQTINDVSETSQDSIPDAAFDCIINNNGSLQDLKDNIQKFAATI